MLTIGVTGNLGSGKTSVTKSFGALGAKMIFSDDIVHDLLKESTAVKRDIVQRFTESVLTKGMVDRQKLAKIVFNERSQLQQLENILHPRVIQTIRRQLTRYQRRKIKAVVVDVPLLFEAKMESLFDVIVAVSSTKEEQIQRATRRLKISKREALQRLKCQLPAKEKNLLADFIIDNGGTRSQTKKQVAALWRELVPKN